MNNNILFLDAQSDVTASFAEAGARPVHSQEEFLQNYRTAKKETRWISESSTLDIINHALVYLQPSHSPQSLLLFDRPDPQKSAHWELLRTYFQTLVFANREKHFLPLQELADIITSKNAGDYIIGGEVYEEDKLLLLYRGTLESLPVPLDLFQPSGTQKPDFTKFSIIDWGQTLKFGDYEASVESILYELDKKFRKKFKKNLVKIDNTFGGSFKRLRLLRGLTQASFLGVSDKEIRRIEMNKVRPNRIHLETRKILEQYLKVSFSEIEKF